MPQWQYFTVSRAGVDALDSAHVKFGRTDLDGRRHNCEMFTVSGRWEKSDRLERYYLLGSNDEDLTDVTSEQAAQLIAQAVATGRFGGVAPDEPRPAD